MHPDEAVDLAIQDLRHHASAAAPLYPRPWLRDLGRALVRRYLEGWRWCVREGRTPPAPDVGHLAHRVRTPRDPAPRPPRGSPRARRRPSPAAPPPPRRGGNGR